ncbi:MAG: hypothetical protein Fur0022_35400 [Anaerolineales bacterium]
MNFRIEISNSAFEDLRSLKKSERVLILDAIDRQLFVDPARETRNRKILRENVLSRWELRVGKYRVFYNVDEEQRKIDVTAVGYKEHDTLFIRGKEVKI